MVIAGIPREEIRHTRAVQDWLAEGRQEGEAKGRQEGEALAVGAAFSAGVALLDFTGPTDLAAWLAANT
jgi:predicted transposase YdaD